MSKFNRSAIIAVVVTYKPSLAMLEEMLVSLVTQVSSVVIVDNGSNDDISTMNIIINSSAISLVRNDTNLGIATAHNIGIQQARELGAELVLLMDQDSIPEKDMVDKLYYSISVQTSLCASVGPRYFDQRQNNPPPFIRISGLCLVRGACTSDDSSIPVDYLIASGCLIPMVVLDKVGCMRDELFIDYVDIEWGLRAKFNGFQSYGVCSAHMQHSLGDQPIKIFNKQFPLHSPLRHYYHFRNAILLYKEPWIPFNWKLVDGWRLCLKFGFYSIFTQPRLSHIKMMLLGVWHGMVGKSGKYMGDAA